MSHPSPGVSIRPLALADVADMLRIEAEAYPPSLREGEAMFASRLRLAASYCLAATRDGQLIAYLIAHGWPARAPPALGSVLSDGPSEVLYIQDLAVSPAGRGLKIGEALVAHAFERAADDGLPAAELIAVEGAGRYWRSLGFREAPVSRALAGKVASYGPEARWMSRKIG
ncbi:GNAT family N-acetyltransferase [Phenylobacterium sp. SCN 70-31]|uniref:GNAT family N-acetyltransferase n=1 Tax=Phenylobacterium sp. SCN 70-31 TaxID=1660129 RepID=UPI00086D947F|nr:GNAT family N-acetyltransferase [Phenylobacterium sp. SCN 70-31]ODT89525.1 MAG: GNAT family N-acetyltransferase [Phenylobacterium sp. SCN 70-31]